MNKWIRRIMAVVLAISLVLPMTACSGSASGSRKKRIIRIAHMQSEQHPEHIGLLAFKKYIEDRLGDKYDVQIYPNELLGSALKTIELTQTGAIDFVVAGAPNFESFAPVYQIFSMPYLFTSEEAYFATMNDTKFMRSIYNSTDDTGFRALTWYNAGTRSFYATKPINTPADMKGMKFRVQQSPASVSMCQAFGAAATPMSFGEVYTAIQQHVIDGAENNELALTENKHGEVAKYFTYTEHQRIPDLLAGNTAFLKSLSPEEYKIFQEAAEKSTEVELKEWDKEIEEARKTAEDDMGVKFIHVDTTPFQECVQDLNRQLLKENPKIRSSYEHIQKVDAKYEKKEETK